MSHGQAMYTILPILHHRSLLPSLYFIAHRFSVIGTALTIVIVVNLVDLAELIAACCRKHPARPALFAYAPVKLLSRPSQIYTIVLTAAVLGLFYGLIFGIISAVEVSKANQSSTPYNPWPAARAYAMYWLPVSAALGFIGLLVVLTCLRPATATPELDTFNKATFDTYDARGVYLRAGTEEKYARSRDSR